MADEKPGLWFEKQLSWLCGLSSLQLVLSPESTVDAGFFGVLDGVCALTVAVSAHCQLGSIVTWATGLWARL